MDKLSSVKILDVNITTDSEGKILEYIDNILKNGLKKAYIVTPNPEILMYSRSHPAFRNILNEADVALPDGVGVSIAGYLTGKGHIPRIAGVDLMEKLCARLAKSPYSTGFYGAQRGVAEETAECLQKKYSGLKVSYASHVWNQEELKGKKIDVLFVAMGCPAQEEWIHTNLKEIPVTLAMAVGGSFDFISGNVPRAPHFLRTVGLEWLFRLVRQPWRWRRQLALVSFSLRILEDAFKRRAGKGV